MPTDLSSFDTVMSRVATLDGFVEATSAGDGMSVFGVEPLTVVNVETRNSFYRIVIRDRHAVFVRGGRFFPETSAAHLAGSTYGGALLKIGWIGVGMRMEIHGTGGPVVTSPVRRISVERPAARTH